jgi:hypothetical protein
VSVAVISETAKPSGASCLFAGLQDLRRDFTSRPFRVHKKSSNLRSAHGRIEQLILCVPLAPPAAADEQVPRSP